MRLWPITLLAMAAVQIQAEELNARLRLTLEHQRYDQHSPYSVPKSILPRAESGSQQNLELGWQKGGFNFTATLWNQISRNSKPRHKSFFNELYLDTQLAGEDISLGRKIISWGVGFGFRPLDVLQQENRRALNSTTLRGINLISWDKFFETAAINVIWSNPGRGQCHKTECAHRDESFAIKYYDTILDADVHAVARYSNRAGIQLGLGISSVSGEDLEWHGSFLWQQYFSKSINQLTLPEAHQQLSTKNPFRQQNFHHAIKLLAGTSWTHSSGWGLLGEVWYDGSAYTRTDWQQINTLTSGQRQLLSSNTVPAQAILANIAYNQQVFQQNNLQRWNTLLRISRQDNSLEPAIEWLYTPEDRGWVTTLRLDYKLNKQLLQIGMRFFGGVKTAAYSLLPLNRQLFVNWEGNF